MPMPGQVRVVRRHWSRLRACWQENKRGGSAEGMHALAVLVWSNFEVR